MIHECRPALSVYLNMYLNGMNVCVCTGGTRGYGLCACVLCMGGSVAGVKEKRGKCVFMRNCAAVMVAK